MAQATRYTFTYREIAEVLIKKQEIHEGLWSVYLRFGIQAANVSGAEGTPLLPTAIVPVLEIGLQQRDKPDELTVDAQKVNPKKGTKKKVRKQT